ncbi:hypothetical protein [Botrimarina mediterranea]|uniref:Uncharacterized protein n=1 Tax=Botrimarina mediterranea TaxID=2528022 RepID=A0A518K756_9BACT|nr:hypothetical protein [Botrimarina mediterranea]QDV73642.1 hypothetical protein Spa11_18410 [Botrimarina mediterranea]QDV78232.1 hypothetical protein K2D_18390 [Planctomycetes bacterium K2D]
MTTPQTFATADDFLAYLRVFYAAPASGDNPDTEMVARTQADMQALQPGAAYTPEQLNMMSVVGEQLKAEVYGSLSPEVAARVHPCIALGVLDTGEANAAIYKSSDGKYAILINTGLMQLLNKFVKIIIAWDDPRLVTYCNLTPAEDLTVAQLREYLPELV